MALIEGDLRDEIYMGQWDDWLIAGWDAEQWQSYAEEEDSEEAYAIARFLRNQPAER